MRRRRRFRKKRRNAVGEGLKRAKKTKKAISGSTSTTSLGPAADPKPLLAGV